MNEEVLFYEMDLDGDGRLSRDDIRHAAVLFGWEWQQASLYAVLDLMTIRGPIDMETFIAYMTRLSRDPDGPYGEVLRMVTKSLDMEGRRNTDIAGGKGASGSGAAWSGAGMERIIDRLERALGESGSGDFRAALKRLNTSRLQVKSDETALLVIDPQRSFTEGSWKLSLGADGEREVSPIEAAFDNCVDLLKAVYHRSHVMFTRCPFPPDSYGWDERFEGLIDADQFYFIKPGNCVLLPATNGFREWLDGMISGGKNTLVMGGCTLNSCLRISSLETLSAFRDAGLNIIVDLSISGARAGNYVNSQQFGGVSAVEMAIRQMDTEGVKVTEGVEWT